MGSKQTWEAAHTTATALFFLHRMGLFLEEQFLQVSISESIDGELAAAARSENFQILLRPRS
jgi:hypothetical protein